MSPMVTVGGEYVQAARVWVHLGRHKQQDHICSYCVHVPFEIAEEVFYSRKPTGTLWKDHIWSEIKDLGTFVVDGYLENFARTAGEERGPFEWVIISVDEVAETEDGIRFSGKARRFDKKMGTPELRTLE